MRSGIEYIRVCPRCLDFKAMNIRSVRVKRKNFVRLFKEKLESDWQKKATCYLWMNCKAEVVIIPMMHYT